MKIRSRFPLVAAALLALSLAACGSDSSPTGTPNDTTPPGVSAVTPVDAYHIDVTFSEQVTKTSAENESNYTITETGATPVAPRGIATAKGAGFPVVGATLKNDNKTVTLATGTSMSGFDFDLTVHNVSDMTGNKIGEAGVNKSFTGSNTTDTTAPTVSSHKPLSDATNIVITAQITALFSETINAATASLTYDGGTIPTTTSIDGATLTVAHDPLPYNTLFTVAVTGTDVAGNTSSITTWSFTTAANNDHTPPTLVSTSPANLATNVNVNANLSITFSEAIDSTRNDVQLTPDVGDGVAVWSNGGKTVTFDPTAPLLTNQQYTLTIYPNGVYDWAGNGIAGLHTVTFTTGATLSAGSIAGTVTGDAGTPAADPTGATVFAADGIFFNGSFNILGSTKVAGNNTYSIPYLTDGTYYLVGVMDTNSNGNLEPGEGDAIGAYGIDVAHADLDPDSVAISGGNHATGINFPLIDPSAVTGTVTYTGAVKGDYPVFVGLFDTTGFSATDSVVVGTEASGIDREWGFNTLDQAIPEDDYYVGAFMDLNLNGNFDPGIEPSGFFGGLPTPTVVHIKNGIDTAGIVIHITDPITTLSAPARSMMWPKAKHNAAFQRMVEIVRQGQQQASR